MMHRAFNFICAALGLLLLLPWLAVIALMGARSFTLSRGWEKRFGHSAC